MTVQRQSVRDQVRRALTDRILGGFYQPGERLIELQIAGEFGVSQGSVREALRELEAARIVESKPHRGTRVRMVTPRELREAYYVRGILEQTAAEGAAVKFKGNTGALRAEYEGIKRAALAGDPTAYAAHNHAFHRLIVAAAENQVLLRMWDSLQFETQTRVRLNTPDVNPVDAAETHLPILDALDRGDAEFAGVLLREHAAAFSPPDSHRFTESPSPDESCEMNGTSDDDGELA